MLLIALVVVLNVNFISSDICADINYSCESCVIGNANSFSCVWCADEVHNDTRCRLPGNPIVTPSWCQNRMNPLTKPIITISNDDFRPKTEKDKVVELKPQHVSIKARPLDAVDFTMVYKPNLDRPIDVYYFFDNSEAMKMYKEQFQTQASKIYEALKAISRDVRFGIGFLRMEHSDTTESDHATIFKNNKESKEVITDFVDINVLEHENSLKTVLKGLLQALESKDITWVDDARRIFVLFCDPRNTRHGLNLSDAHEIDKIVRKINKIAKTKLISIIFTGLRDFQEEYKALAKKIQGSSYVEFEDITDKFENNVDLAKVIKGEYMKLVHTLELDVGVIPSYLSISIKPPCNLLGRRCVRKIYQDIPFTMTAKIRMFDCPSHQKFKDTFEVKPIGSHEKWTIDTDILCKCACTDKAEANSLKCNSMGEYTCGICKCYDGRYGDQCQCIGDEVEDGWQKCRAGPEDFNANICNGQGDCICGVCHCYDGYSGEHCTVDLNTCLPSGCIIS